MKSPPISVLLPFRNAAPYIGSALDSLAGQTFGDFEVIMVDDGSEDGSHGLALDRSLSDSRFRLVKCTGKGLVDALNTGLSYCRGTWVARMDADDVCTPRRLSLQLEQARLSGERTVVTCRVRSFPETEVTPGYRAYEDWINGLTSPGDIRRNIFVESPVPHPTAFFHRESIIGQGGYTERELPEDYELWLRLWSRGFSFIRVPRVLLLWRDRSDRFSRTSPAYSLTSFYRLKARYLSHVPCMSGREAYVAGGGQTARRLGKCMQENGFTIRAFIDPSAGTGTRELRGCPVLPPAALRERGDVPVVIATRVPGARDEIIKLLKGLGLQEWKDFVACS